VQPSLPRAEAAARDLAEYRRHADKTFEEAAQADDLIPAGATA